jgi:hypothetical protein
MLNPSPTDHAIAEQGVGALALSVIQNAILDASRPGQGAETARNRQTAVSFLTDTQGDWARSFDAWCGIAGLEPEWARVKCAEVLAMRRDAGSPADQGGVAGGC